MKAIVTLILALVAVALLAEPVADFTLEDIAGQKVQLSQLLKHGPVLVNFWATWCINCKKEMPKLSELQTKYPGITVLCITIDKPGKKAEAIKEVKNRYSFRTLFDPDKKVYTALNATNPPSTFILNTKGEIVWSHEGYKPGDEAQIEAQIRKALGL